MFFFQLKFRRKRRKKRGVKFSIFICFWRLKYLSSPNFRLKQKFHTMDTSSPLLTSHQYRFRALSGKFCIVFGVLVFKTQFWLVVLNYHWCGCMGFLAVFFLKGIIVGTKGVLFLAIHKSFLHSLTRIQHNERGKQRTGITRTYKFNR